MDSPILGLNFGTHDAAAALVIDGAVAAAAEEERFSRSKQTKAFPTQAAAYCLREAGVEPGDIKRAALFVKPRLQLMLPLTNLRQAFPAALGSTASDFGKYRSRSKAPDQIRSSGLVAEHCQIIPVRHHLAHAASAYLTSNFAHATVVTIDGRGEYESCCIFEGRDGKLRRVHSVAYPHSIGYLYSMMTKYLGFRPQRDEYKVMGLAAYGSPSLVPVVREFAAFDGERGRLRLDLDYFDHHRRPSHARQLFSDKLIRLLGPARSAYDPIDDHHRDIAFAVQQLTEELVLGYVAFAQRLVPGDNLCMAGGVALNAVANGAVIESGIFKAIHIQPAANDAGTSVGAALVAASQNLGKAPRWHMRSAFLGPAASTTAVQAAISQARDQGCDVRTVDDPCRVGAELLARNQIIGWVQGRMEFGPRALGARSILANPMHASNTSRVNALIKRREAFRPLAPAVLEEDGDDYFVLSEAGRSVYPFMLATAKVRPTQAEAIPAVVHQDGSARVQTVSRNTNPLMWGIIDAFKCLTGVPVVLNTSFNDADEPIVCTPVEAVRTFLACGLDALLIGDMLVTPRREQ
ncbi:carbamoyltransferase family protein [Catenulispora subtropica]|uniref:Carbamoyltransferase n=1 Tax=Catenulispora subtropica TaxID=450798 RepID=A0ABP5ENC3_9ACTN